MKHKGRRLLGILAPLLMIGIILPSSCAADYAPEFPFFWEGPADAGETLRALSKKSASGVLVLEKKQTLEYGFASPLELPPDCSLEIDYAVEGGPAIIREISDAGQLTLEAGGVLWALPLDASFVGLEQQPTKIRYVAPVSSLEKISVSWTPHSQEGTSRQPKPGDKRAIKILGLGLVKRWYGFSLDDGILSITPFVYVPGGQPRSGGVALPAVLGVNPPEDLRIAAGVDLTAEGAGAAAVLTETGPLSFERLAVENEGPNRLFVPSGSLPSDPWPFTVQSAGGIASLRVRPAPNRPFPDAPIPADLGLVLDYPQSAWRDSRYEVFRWEDFPSVLVFDFADYAVQDRFLKRLAFFVEKAEFRGRLAADREIAFLHGWNAHDYRPQDLAAFFEAARGAGFPLLPEEQELEQLLAKTGVLRREEDGSIAAGEGAIISISRESPDYLRLRLLAHESFHGLFFIDQEFREFSRGRWENLSPQASRFIRAFFDSMAYDTRDTDLMINELMAYCLQQPVSQAARYFGETQASRLAELPLRRSALPPRDEATGAWPTIAAAFRAEAAAFSAYVERRWGLAAGRVRQVQVRNLP
ncbi:MAG: hypothetical protein LBU16_08895 [Treponema sp.]|jgi:hypothetical protein|nr:hypothetical protein [Treponema sp.]